MIGVVPPAQTARTNPEAGMVTVPESSRRDADVIDPNEPRNPFAKLVQGFASHRPGPSWLTEAAGTHFHFARTNPSPLPPPHSARTNPTAALPPPLAPVAAPCSEPPAFSRGEETADEAAALRPERAGEARPPGRAGDDPLARGPP